jgi:hypothetical protein
VSAFELNYNEGGLNLMRVTAFHGDKDGVRALIEKGASYSDAVYGAAFGGQHELVDAILAEILATKPAEHRLLREAAARGYSRAGDEAKLAVMRDDTDTLKLSIILGCAETRTKEERVRAALNLALSQGKSEYFPNVCCALAATGQTDFLLDLIKGVKLYPEILQSAAKAGHPELVKKLLAHYGANLDEIDELKPGSKEKLLADIAMVGYSEGRHFPEVLELLVKGATVALCLSALEASGKLDKDGRTTVLDEDDAIALIHCAKHDKYKAVTEELLGLMEKKYGLVRVKIMDESPPVPPDLSLSSGCSFGISKG